MGEFNVDKTTGDLIPTAGYGGMIKINGTTLAQLVTALNGLTEDQKNRCEILIYLNNVTVTNFYVLRRYNKSVGAGGGEVYDTYSNSYVDVNINNETTTLRQTSIYLFIYNNSAIVRRAYGSNGYDLTSSVTSWSILYQDDSISGGNTYPASQVLLEDGETNIEDAFNDLGVNVANALSNLYGFLNPIGFDVTLNTNKVNFADGTSGNDGANICLKFPSLKIALLSLSLNISSTLSDTDISVPFTLPRNVRVNFNTKGNVTNLPYISYNGKLMNAGYLPTGEVKIFAFFRYS